MTIHVTATQLRKDVYHLLDQVVNSGEIIEVKRKGKLVRIVPVGSVSKLASLKPHSSAITGNPDDLVHTDWSENWKPEL
ncbi:MAG: type II toxin-antitoxin system Phd/YefM family antitoxin [Mariprofundus sp.]